MQQGPIPYTTFLARCSVLADGLTINEGFFKERLSELRAEGRYRVFAVSNGAAAVFRAPLTTGSAPPYCVLDIYKLLN
jgi:hypothetical protein